MSTTGRPDAGRLTEAGPHRIVAIPASDLLMALNYEGSDPPEKDQAPAWREAHQRVLTAIYQPAAYTCPTACVEQNHPGREHDTILASRAAAAPAHDGLRAAVEALADEWERYAAESRRRLPSHVAPNYQAAEAEKHAAALRAALAAAPARDVGDSGRDRETVEREAEWAQADETCLRPADAPLARDPDDMATACLATWSTPGQLKARHDQDDHCDCPKTWCRFAALRAALDGVDTDGEDR